MSSGSKLTRRRLLCSLASRQPPACPARPPDPPSWHAPELPHEPPLPCCARHRSSRDTRTSSRPRGPPLSGSQCSCRRCPGPSRAPAQKVKPDRGECSPMESRQGHQPTPLPRRWRYLQKDYKRRSPETATDHEPFASAGCLYTYGSIRCPDTHGALL